MLGQPRRKRTHPGQALKKPEAQPLPGCEDTVITTSGLAKASHFIPRRILSHVERRRGTKTLPLSPGSPGSRPFSAPGQCPLCPPPPAPATGRCSAPLSFRIPRCQLSHSAVTIGPGAAGYKITPARPPRGGGGGRKAGPSRGAKEHQLHLEVAKLAGLLFCF